MTAQPNLFDSPLPPAQRAETSRLAAVSVASATGVMRLRVLTFLRDRGALGATDEEIADALQMAPNTARPRRCELADPARYGLTGAPLIVAAPVRRQTRSGRTAIVWRAL